MDSLPGVAILIDFENIWFSYKNNYGHDLDLKMFFPNLRDMARNKHKILTAIAFADWLEFTELMPKVQSLGFEIRYAPKRLKYGTEVRKENITDIAMSLEGLTIALTLPDVERFILLSGDNDFSELVHRLLRLGKDVILVGLESSTGSELISAATEFIPLERVLGYIPGDEEDAEAPIRAFIQLMNRWEDSSMSYIGLSHVAKELLPDSIVGDDYKDRFNFINMLIEKSLLIKYEVDTPSKMNRKAIGIKLNRKHPLVRKTLKDVQDLDLIE